MKIKNTKNFIDFCNEIGINSFFNDKPVKKFSYSIKNSFLKQNILNKKSNHNYNKLDLLNDLRIKVEKLNCSIKNTATKLVFGDGNINADVMLVGEAPGSEEDRSGIPFVGQAGELLNKMLTSIKIERKNCYVTNVIFWRPPGNRVPSKDEIQTCLPFLKEHIKIINPKFLILMGNVASKSLIDPSLGITKISGKKFDYVLNGKKIPCWPIFHPAFLLRNSNAKKSMWIVLCKIFYFMKKYYEN